MPVARIDYRYVLYIKLQILDASKPVEKTELVKKIATLDKKDEKVDYKVQNNAWMNSTILKAGFIMILYQGLCILNFFNKIE